MSNGRYPICERDADAILKLLAMQHLCAWRCTKPTNKDWVNNIWKLVAYNIEIWGFYVDTRPTGMRPVGTRRTATASTWTRRSGARLTATRLIGT